MAAMGIMNRIMATRREFVAGGLTAVAAAGAAPGTTSYFTLRREAGRWWFFTPAGKRFFSIGLNHIDPASLNYPENRHIWHEKYGNSMRRWLEESVRPNLLNWGFNAAGWVEIAARPHSR